MDFFNKLFGFKKEEDFASTSNDNKIMDDLNSFADGIFTGLTNAFEDTKRMIDGEANKTGDNIKKITGEVNTFFKDSANKMAKGLEDMDNFVEKNRSRITEDVKNVVDTKRVELQNAFTENNKKVSEMYSKTVCDKLCNKYNKIENVKLDEIKQAEKVDDTNNPEEREMLDKTIGENESTQKDTPEEFVTVGGKGKKSSKKSSKKTKKQNGGKRKKIKKRRTKKKKQRK